MTKKQDPIYAVVDVETTGPKFEEGARIFQIGCTFIQNDVIIDDYCFDVYPGHLIPPSIQRLTNITNKQVKNAPTFDEIASMLHALLENTILVGHNVVFDYKFIKQSFEELAQLPFEAEMIDTVPLAQILLPTAESYRLSALTSYFSIEHTHVHSAGSDAMATAHLLVRLKQEFAALPLVTLEKCLQYTDGLLGQTGSIIQQAFVLAKQKKYPLPPHQVVVHGLALQEQDLLATTKKVSLNYSLNELYQMVKQQLRKKERVSQYQLSQYVEQFFDSEQPVGFIQAPAGVGKTMAYLLEALKLVFQGHTVWISTGTLLLQQQLVEKELKPLLEMLQLDIPYLLLKGQQHYIHLHKFHQLLQKEDYYHQPRYAQTMMGLLVWLTFTKTGDLGECNAALYQKDVWQIIQQSSKKSKFKEFEFVHQLDKKLQFSPLVITNHAYLWHYAHQEELPKQAMLIIDECHQFGRFIREYEKKQFSILLLSETMKRIIGAYGYMRNTAKQLPEWTYTIYKQSYLVEQKIQTLVALMEQEPFYSFSAHEWVTSSWFQELSELYDELEQWLTILHQTNKHWVRSRWFQKLDNFEKTTSVLPELIEKVEQDYQQLANFFDVEEHHYFVVEYAYYEEQERLTVSKWLADIRHSVNEMILQPFQQVLCVSATLPEDNLVFDKKLIQEQAFVLSQKSVPIKVHVLVPNDSADSEDAMTQAMHIKQIYQATGGKMLVLVHSKEMLEFIYMYLENYALMREWDLTAQGISGSARKLQRRFEQKTEGILLGLASFWEGYDVTGLHSVVITKLPFANPTDTEQRVLQKYASKQELSYFQDISLPQMIQTLKQGIGRMMRSNAKGALVWLLDKRVASSSYATNVQRELPVSKITIEPLKKCLEKIKNSSF